MPLRTAAEALRDVTEAAAYYGRSDWHRSQRFIDAYDDAAARIDADPTSLPLYLDTTDPNVRFIRIRGFPYVILFRTADPAETVILAALHTAAGSNSVRRAERRA